MTQKPLRGSNWIAKSSLEKGKLTVELSKNSFLCKNTSRLIEEAADSQVRQAEMNLMQNAQKQL